MAEIASRQQALVHSSQSFGIKCAPGFPGVGQLKLERLVNAAKQVDYPLTYRLQQSYDRSYFFIATFIGEHIAFHAGYLLAAWDISYQSCTAYYRCYYLLPFLPKPLPIGGQTSLNLREQYCRD